MAARWRRGMGGGYLSVLVWGVGVVKGGRMLRKTGGQTQCMMRLSA